MMMKKKLFQNIQPSTYVFLCIAVAIATSLIGYAVGKGEISLLSQELHQVTQNKITFKEPYTIPSEEKEDWLTHVNEEFGYQISFPENWEYGDEDISKIIGVDYPFENESGEERTLPLSVFSALSGLNSDYSNNRVQIQVQVYTNKISIKKVIETYSRKYRDIESFTEKEVFRLFPKLVTSYSFTPAISSREDVLSSYDYSNNEGVYVHMSEDGITFSQLIEKNNKIFILSYNVAYLALMNNELKPIPELSSDDIKACEKSLSPDLVEIADSFTVID